MACQLICDTYSPSDKLFTQLGSGEFTDGTASCIYRLLANASGDQVTQNLKSHSARRGSAVQASSHPEVNLCDLSHRGRWNMESLNTLMEYVAATSAADHEVGRVLGGWEYPRSKVIPPRFQDDSTLQGKSQRAFATALMQRQQPFLHRCDFLHVLVVTLVMHFRATHDLQPQHTLHSTMVEVLQATKKLAKFSRGLAMFFEWSDDIRARFAAENAMSLPLDKLGQTIASCGDQVPAPLESSATHVDTVVRLGHTVSSLAADVAHIRRTVGMIVNQQQELLDQQAALLAMLRSSSVPIPPPRQHSQPLVPHRESRLSTASSVILAHDAERQSHGNGRKWPKTLQTLKDVSFASLIYQFLHEQLEQVPLESKNYAQRDAHHAMRIAYHLMGESKRQSFSVMRTSRQQSAGRAADKGLARSIQQQALKHLA
ncbi:TPA: hypothetical protein N0F65_011754 [Lagenidium giganteum]|uniref:Ndc10 domain-containing protein n=1 Tax=Lagenidium giganteum TaxID=4803 RepID=A0AAV2YU03_9STRA|nr:TPA: hypothetical protein N0F65_011754 [Lagenidium giganteum]